MARSLIDSLLRGGGCVALQPKPIAKTRPVVDRRAQVTTRYPRRRAGEIIAGKILEEVRVARGLSLDTIANDLGVDRDLVAAWCSGIKAFHVGDIVALRDSALRGALWAALIEAPCPSSVVEAEMWQP